MPAAYFVVRATVPDPAKRILVAERRKVIDVIKPAITGKGEQPLLGDRQIQLKFPDLEI